MDGTRSPDLLACYGLLMGGFQAQRELGAESLLRLVGPCRIAGRLRDMGEWPSLTREQGIVQGELFEVLDHGVFELLDPFENYLPHDPRSSSYIRSVMTLIEPEVQAWVYVATDSLGEAPAVPSGSWYEHAGLRGTGAAG
jgi:gamma-glutamylcyclotransferase (GGCT)/AIG2-like uncharacterized protein YtfP